MRELNPDVEKQLRDAIESNPEFVEKYGDPTDPTDPRHWQPSSRGEKGLSINDRVKLLELDMDLLQMSVGRLLNWMAEKQKQELLSQLQRDPKGFLAKMSEELGVDVPPELEAALASGQAAPVEVDERGAITPDAMVPTVNGPVPAHTIPGYRFEPGWRPSEEWADENCPCEIHQQMRREGKIPPAKTDDLPGLYL